MHAVVRSYSGTGAKELFDLLTQRKADVEALIRGVTGSRAPGISRGVRLNRRACRFAMASERAGDRGQ